MTQLHLTDDQIETLQYALFVAEETCQDMFKTIAAKFRVEGDKAIKMYFFDKANKIHDLGAYITRNV